MCDMKLFRENEWKALFSDNDYMRFYCIQNDVFCKNAIDCEKADLNYREVK